MSDRLHFSDLSEINEEFRRLSTFDTWPNSSQAWPSALARAGFYYEGNGDETRCFQCGCVIRNWQGRGDPFEEHRRVNPHCPHVMREGTQRSSPGGQPHSVPTHSSPSFSSGDSTVDYIHTTRNCDSNTSNTNKKCDSSLRLPGRPLTSMVNEAERLETFSNWPQTCPAIPEELARAGLYFVGSADRVKCAFCQNVLLHWEEGDIPIVEHRRHFPHCPFVQGRDVGNIPIDQNDMVTNNSSLHTQTRHPNSQNSIGALCSSEDSIGLLTCKVCLDEEATIVCLPCEHMCCCLDCSREVERCPVCRKDILATVSVFLA